MKDVQTILEFCRDYGISRTLFYELSKQGKGPRVIRLGRRVVISREAKADWNQEREAESKAAEGKAAK